MKIIAFGDSFTMGLITEPKRLTDIEANENSFVNRLTKILPVEGYKNYAEPGASNLQIAYNFKNWLLKNRSTNDFVFIGWTTYTRDTAWNNKKLKYETVNKNKNAVQKISFDTEMAISSTIQLLNQFNIKYSMIQAFQDHTLSQKNFLLSKTEELPNWINWNKNNNTIWDICKEQYLDDKQYDENKNYFKLRSAKTKYLAPCLHPSFEGHQLIAETLAPYIKEQL